MHAMREGNRILLGRRSDRVFCPRRRWARLGPPYTLWAPGAHIRLVKLNASEQHELFQGRRCKAH